MQWSPDNSHKKYEEILCELSRMYKISKHRTQWNQWEAYKCANNDCANYLGCANKREANYPGSVLSLSSATV